MRRIAIASVVSIAALAFSGSSFALAPSDVRLVAGSMPGYPMALPQIYPEHQLTAARRKLLARRFAQIRIGGESASAISSMGHIHKTVGYGPGKNCDYFDGKFVLCVIEGRIVAKGFQISG
jgi:hypothetical protein